MTTLVVGANGATGQQLVQQLLLQGQQVKAIIRPSASLPEAWKDHKNITVIRAQISELSLDEMTKHLQGCQAIASCLGHRPTLQGIFGKPRKLVTNAVKLLCSAAQKQALGQPIKVVLMNTTGNRNQAQDKPLSWLEKIIVGLVRLLVPPHSDNEKAAAFLSQDIGLDHPQIEWVTVRPDSLVDQAHPTAYEVVPTPTRSAIFNPGKTSRINVGHFMAQLIVDHALWATWKGQMPVIYNQNQAS